MQWLPVLYQRRAGQTPDEVDVGSEASDCEVVVSRLPQPHHLPAHAVRRAAPPPHLLGGTVHLSQGEGRGPHPVSTHPTSAPTGWHGSSVTRRGQSTSPCQYTPRLRSHWVARFICHKERAEHLTLSVHTPPCSYWVARFICHKERAEHLTLSVHTPPPLPLGGTVHLSQGEGRAPHPVSTHPASAPTGWHGSSVTRRGPSTSPCQYTPRLRSYWVARFICHKERAEHLTLSVHTPPPLLLGSTVHLSQGEGRAPHPVSTHPASAPTGWHCSSVTRRGQSTSPCQYTPRLRSYWVARFICHKERAEHLTLSVHTPPPLLLGGTVHLSQGEGRGPHSVSTHPASAPTGWHSSSVTRRGQSTSPCQYTPRLRSYWVARFIYHRERAEHLTLSVHTPPR